MRIIQDESRVKNLALAYEMQEFFEDESGELDAAMRSQKLIGIVQIFSLALIELGILLFMRKMFITDTKSIYEVCKASMMFLLCIIIAIGSYVYSIKEQKELIRTRIFNKYGPVELMIYWLFTGPKPQMITLSSNREEIYIHKENSVISLDVDGFQIEGTGREVHTVDLDDLILMTM